MTDDSLSVIPAPLRPILAVDVDGVLNRCDWRAREAPAGWLDAKVLGFRIRHNPGHGAALLAVAERTGAELAWCTTWEQLANDHIRHLVGLPELPVVPMKPGKAGLRFGERRSVGVTKAMAMAAYAGDRPFCWLDDEPDAADELAVLCDTPHLVVRVDEETGLADEHLKLAEAWLAGWRVPT